MAGRDASEVLELVEEAFDEVALAVQVIGHRAPRQAAAVDDDMDFGAQPASRASDGVVRTLFFPPAACWWARTTEASRR